jgi:hypothetical protein
MGHQTKFNAGRFRRWLRRWGVTFRIWLTKAFLWVGAIYRFKSSFMGVILLCVGCGLFGGACAPDDDWSDKRSQRHQHRGGSYSNGQSGGFDRPGASQSSIPIPGL